LRVAVGLRHVIIAKTKITWHVFIAFLPIILIGASLFFVFMYHQLLNGAISELRIFKDFAKSPASEILAKADIDLIPNGVSLGLYYLGIFITAEASFLLMAIKEYLQDLVGLSDIILIQGRLKPSEKRSGHSDSTDGRTKQSG